MSTSSANFFKQGYVPFSGNPNEYHRWSSLFRSIMYETGLGEVMSGTETAPEAPVDGTADAVAAYETKKRAFKQKNGRLFTRLDLATSDCDEGFRSAASLVVGNFNAVYPEEWGDGRAAFLALEAKYRKTGAFRMQELQQQLGSLSVTAADKYDPARVIQELRRISAELDALGDKVVSTRKTHTFLNALPDQQYGQFKAALVCEQSRDDNSDLNLDFERVAHRATAFHSLQIRGKDNTHDDGSGSHGRALNTAVHGGAREFRKHGGRGRNRRGNGGKNADGNNSSSNGNSSSGGTNSNGNPSGGRGARSAQGARGKDRGNQNSGGSRGRGQQNGQDRKRRCRYCHNSTEHQWNDCPLRLSNEAEDAKEQANVSQESTTTQAWHTQVRGGSNGLEDFSITIDACPRVQEVPAATQAEKRVAEHPQVPEVPAAAKPEERAAGYTQVLEAPAAAKPEERAAGYTQVLEAPAAAQPKACAAGDTQVLEALAVAPPEECADAVGDVQALMTPGVAMDDEPAAVHVQVEEAPGATETVAFTSVFQVKEQVKSLESTTVFIDTAASSHMVWAESPVATHVGERYACNVQVEGSCGQSNATQKGKLKFGLRNDKNETIPVSLEVLLVPDLGANIFSVGALEEKGVLCDLMSTPPALRGGQHAFPISKEIPRMYVVNIIVDDVSLGRIRETVSHQG